LKENDTILLYFILFFVSRVWCVWGRWFVQHGCLSTDVRYHRFSCWDWSFLIKSLVSRAIALIEQKASDILQDVPHASGLPW